MPDKLIKTFVDYFRELWSDTLSIKKGLEWRGESSEVFYSKYLYLKMLDGSLLL